MTTRIKDSPRSLSFSNLIPLLTIPFLFIFAGCGIQKRPIIGLPEDYSTTQDSPHAPPQDLPQDPPHAPPQDLPHAIPQDLPHAPPQDSPRPPPAPPPPIVVPERPCTIKDKLHNTQELLQELKLTTRDCLRQQIYHSGLIKGASTGKLFIQVLEALEGLPSAEIISITNYLELIGYFLYFDFYDNSWEIPKELITRHREMLKEFTESYSREKMSPQFKKGELVDYEFNLIWNISMSTQGNEILEFLDFLMDCTNNGYNELTQYRAISAITLDMNNFLYIVSEPEKSSFYDGISPAFLEWYVTLFSHPSIYVQIHTLHESRVFSKARPDVAAFIKQKVLEHIDRDINYWTRMWAIKALYFGFKAREDLHSNRLDIESEKQKFISKNMPNSFKMDHITYRTAMSETQIRDIHIQLMAIQQVFFQITQMTDPVKGDTHPELTIIIVNSKDNYWDYMPLFEDIQSNNGGIYIESRGTLYTYERTSQESRFTVEELLKHEYTHYLMGRYIIQGSFGEAGTVYDKKIRWFDEGVAEFFVGVDLQKNLQLRANLISEIKHDGTNRMQLDQIFTSSDDDGFEFYRYAYTFIYFLHTNHPDIFKEVVRSIANNYYYFKSYDDNSLTKVFATDLAALNREYQDFLQLLVEGIQPAVTASL